MAEDPWYIETLGRVMEQNLMRTHCTRRGEGMTLKEHKYNWHKNNIFTSKSYIINLVRLHPMEALFTHFVE